MKKLVVASVAVATILLAAASDAQASCFRRGGCGGCASAPGDCGQFVSYQGAPCATCSSPCVTYQQVWKEKEEVVTVLKRTPRTEQFEYTVCTPVMTPEKRKVTVCQNVMKEVEFKYVECTPVTTAEKRKVVQYTCVPTTVECDVPCYSTVMVPCCTPPSCCNPCGGVGYTCQRVCTMQKVTRTVMKQVPQEVEVTVNVCTFNRVEKVGKRQVCERVMVEQEVTVNVCKLVTEKKTGTRTVIDCVPTQEKVMVKYCELVPVTTAAVAPAPIVNVGYCDTGCNQCNQPRGCFSGCGLFGGHGGSCFSGCGLFGGHGGSCFSGCGLGGHGGGFGGCFGCR
jgi:hypothetical protein